MGLLGNTFDLVLWAEATGSAAAVGILARGELAVPRAKPEAGTNAPHHSRACVSIRLG